jgi:hypothetical protein
MMAVRGPPDYLNAKEMMTHALQEKQSGRRKKRAGDDALLE